VIDLKTWPSAEVLAEGKHLGDAEVEHHRLDTTVAEPGQEDVVRLEITMDDADQMGATDRRQHRRHDRRQIDQRNRAAACQVLRERLALQKIHDHRRRAIVQGQDVVHLDDIRMTHGAGRSRLTHEAPQAFGAGDVRLE
jgi:hypothetical protein